MSNRLIPLCVTALSLLLCIVAYQAYIHIASPQVPYMDTMRFLWQIDGLLRGEVSWRRIYHFGDHRGLIYPMVILGQWVLWGLDTRITAVLTGFVVAITFWLWLNVLWRMRDESPGEGRQTAWVPLAVLAVASAGVIVSPAGFELWLLDLGFAQLLKNLLIVLFLYELAIRKSWAKSGVAPWVIGSLGGFLILFCTYGWSYPFFLASAAVLALSCLVSPRDRVPALVVFGMLALAQAIYVYAGDGIFSAQESAPSLTTLVKSLFYGAGTAFMGSEAQEVLGVPVVTLVVLGFLLLLACLLTLVFTLAAPTPARNFMAGLTVFSLMTLAGVVVARGGVNFLGSGSSRYFVDYVWLVLAPAAIALSAGVGPCKLPFVGWTLTAPAVMAGRYLVAALFLVALLGHGATWAVELKTAPYRAKSFSAMELIYWSGVETEEDAASLQAPFHDAKRGVDVARAYNLATFRRAACTVDDTGFQGDWYAPEPGGSRWIGGEARFLVNTCRAPVTLQGFLPDSFAARTLRVFYGDHEEEVRVMPGQNFHLTLVGFDGFSTWVTITVDHTTNPQAEGLSSDGRDLGVLITRLANR